MLALLAATSAAAQNPDYGRVNGRLWAVGRGFRTVDASGGPVEFRPIDEYLSVDWADVGRRGVGFDLLMRSRDDLRDDAPGSEVDLLSARLAWRGLRPGLDLTLGRQYLIWGNGYYNFDGLRLDWRWRRGWGAMAFAGAPLGFQEHGGVRGDGRTFGAGVSYERPFVERYVLMAERQSSDGEVEWERLSVDLRRSFGRRLEGYGSADYNAGLGRWGDSLAGARVRLGRRLRAGAEIFRYLPEFPLDSIFNLFPVQPFLETRVEAGWEADAGRGAWLRLGRQRFELSALSERDRPFIELTLRPLRRGSRWLEAGLFQVSGFGGSRRGGRLAGGIGLPWQGVSVRGGADLYDFRNPYRLTESHSLASAWGRLEWQAPRRWNLWLEGRQQWSVLRRRDFETAAGAGVRFGGPS